MTIQNILLRLIAPIFAVFFVAESALAIGYYVRLGTGQNTEIYTSANYPSELQAREAAEEECQDPSTGNSAADCTTGATLRGAIPENGVLLFLNPPRYAGAGADDAAAYSAFIDNCVADGGFTRSTCELSFPTPSAVFLECRDGTARTGADDCGVLFTSSPTAADCVSDTPFFDNGACLRSCPAERSDTAADGQTCIAASNTNPPDNGGGTPGNVGDENVGDPQTSQSGGESISDGGRSHAPALVFGGLMLVGAIGAVASGDLSAFNFSPDFGYSATESGYSYNYGTRINFAKDNWRLYWTAGQTNRDGDFGDFSYASGGEYRSDSGLWTTAFSESISGEIANYDFSLSAKTDFVSPESFGGGIWNLSPTYRFNSVLDWNANESDSRNSLNIESVLRMNRWTIRPTAGFNWRRINEFGDSAKFGISAVHRF